jgi:hypothetical protein
VLGGDGVAEGVGAADGEQDVVVVLGGVDVAEGVFDLSDGVELARVVGGVTAADPPGVVGEDVAALVREVGVARGWSSVIAIASLS